MSDDTLLAAVHHHIGRDSRWKFSVDRGSDLTLRAEHPASQGMGLAGSDEAEVLPHIPEWLADREFAVADAAPHLDHPETVLGVRVLSVAFEWPTVEVRAVAYLFYEAGALTAAEAGWLAGFIAPDAPMEHRPPTGPATP